MIILGVDPGTLFTGYGIISYANGEIEQIAAGVIKMPPAEEIAPRLKIIYDELDRLIKLHKPDEFAIETAFYGKNVQSAMKIGYARGVSLLAAEKNALPSREYSPREVKKSVVGNGAATKEQVQYMIRKLLAVKKVKMKFDESDALAVAICHAFKRNNKIKKKGSWKDFVEANPGMIID